MSKLVLDFYNKYERDPRYSAMLKKRAAESLFCMKFQTISSFILFHLPIVATLVNYLFFGHKKLFLNNYLPYTNPKESSNFFLNLGLQSLLLPVAFIGINFSDMTFIFYGYQTFTLCDMICCHLSELGEDLMKLRDEREKMEIRVGETNENIQMKVMAWRKFEKIHGEKLKKLEGRLIDIIAEHKNYEQFIEYLIFYDGIPNIVQVACNSISIGISIVIFFKISMVIGIAGCEYK